MTDIRAGLAGCHGFYTMADTTAGTMSGSEEEVQVGPLGDSSIGYLHRGSIAIASSGDTGWSNSFYEFVQVGAVIVEVTDYPNGHVPIDPGKLQAQLAIVVKAQVAKLQAT